MFKKGEISTAKLIGIILLVVSFAILLFFLFKLNPGNITDKEVCHNSVVLKDKSVSLAGNLDCKTNYVCISGGGDCEAINAKETVGVGPENKDEIMKAIADEMVDCWWMFGGGEIKYVGGQKTSCAVCSIINFAGISFDEISYQEFYNYLNTISYSESQSYLQYLYGINNPNYFSPQKQVKVDITKDSISMGGKYSIITGIDNNLIGSDQFLKVYLIPTSETSSRTSCDEFITKAA